jgi:mRNA interferase MazF
MEVKFLRPGVFVTQNLVTIPVVKLLKKLGDLPSNNLKMIEDSVRTWLGL